MHILAHCSVPDAITTKVFTSNGYARREKYLKARQLPNLRCEEED